MKAVIFIHVLYLILIKTFMVKGVSKCESKVELRAVLLSCPVKDTGCEDDDLLSQAIKSEESQILQANCKNFDSLKEEKEKGYSNAVKDCKRKLVITLKIKNFGKIPCDDEYIVVDHVFDPVTGGRGRLLSPVVLKLRQEQMNHLYGLQFQRVVNSDPFEEQKTCGQTCSVSPKNPTCGIAMYDGKPIPFSEGFCCSCNPHLNSKRQLGPTTRKDSLLYRDYKMIYQGSPHFVRDGKAPIVDPTLIKLRSDESVVDNSDKKEDCTEFGDPLSWDKIPNYLLEHDRKVVCDRGDFMNELCKLREDKYFKETSTHAKGQKKSGETGKSKKKTAIRRGVKVEEDDLKKRDLTTVTVDVDANKKNVLKDVQGHNVVLLKNLMKTLNVGPSTGAGSLSDNYSSVKGSRGKRENRNENKKLTLEEKLERFVNSKSHLTSPRKRLLELSHKRRRKVEDRCVGGQDCRTIQVPLFLEKSYAKCPLPKYFFSHDKFIIDPVDSVQMVANTTCKISNEIPYEEAEDKTFEPNEKSMDKHEEEIMRQEFYETQSKSEDEKEKLTSGKSNNKKSIVAHNEGEKGANKFKKSLKLPPSLRGSDKYSSLKGAEDNEAKVEEAESQEEKKAEFDCDDERHKEQKTSRLSCKCLKNLFRKCESREKGPRPQKIRNFFMAKSRENQKLKSEFLKIHKKMEENHKKNDSLKYKSLKEEETKDNSEAHEEKKFKEEEKEQKICKTSDEPEEKCDEVPTELYPSLSQKSPPNPPPDQYPSISQKSPPNPPPDQYPSISQKSPPNPPPDQYPNFSPKTPPNPPPDQYPNFSPKIPPNLPPEQYPSFSQQTPPNPSPDQYPNFSPKIPANLPPDQYPNFSQQTPFRETVTQKQTTKEKEIMENIKTDREEEEEMANEEKNYTEQPSEKITEPSGDDLSKDMMSDTDFSFEIIRHKYPEYSKPKYQWNLQKPIPINQISDVPPVFDPEPFEFKKKFNHLKNKQNLYLHHKLPRKYYVLDNEISPNQLYLHQNEKNPFRDIKNRHRYSKERGPESEPEPEFELYDSGGADRRLEPDYKSYLQKRPFLHRRFPKPDYPKYDDELARYGKSLSEKSSGAQRRERHSELLRRFEKRYIKVGYRPGTLEVDLRPRLEKIRNKRSSSYSFQPAKGIFKSEFESQSPVTRIAHELETCLPGQSEKAKKSEKVTGRGSRQSGRQSPRSKRDNASSNANGISNSQRVQSGINCPVITLRQKTIKSGFDKQRLIQSYLNAPDYVLEEVEAALKEKRETTFANKLNCSRESEAAYAGEQETQDTAHCMRYGDMWYSLYSIRKPLVSQTVGIQLFDRHLLWDGTSQWRDLTKGKMIRVGTFLPKAEDELPSISVTFMGENTERAESAIDPESYYLLIPSHVSNPSKVNFYPQFDGGPAEYLLVHSKDVSSGGECNMVGTSFEAFARQPDRCNQPKGSCLKRQPVDLWREDMEARIRGKRGKYFVENFGTVSNSSIKTYTNLSGEFLALEYYGEYTSTIEIEVKADSNAVVRKGSNAQIPLVYVDSTYPKKTRIILSVLNIGLTSSYFRPRLGDCPPDLDPAWCPLEGPLVTIPPQQRHDFKLDLSGVLPSRQILVSVQVLNQVNRKIASRKINIKRGERCVCAFHCKCNCIGNAADDRTCRRLSLKDYRRAGYIGSFPFRGGTAASAPESILKNIHIVFLTAIYVLLLLGVLKGVLGIFIRRIGIAGVKIITGPRELCKYYESELQSCSVLFDEYGFPVHPTTCQPVQIVPLWLETIINVFFFFLYPLRGLWFLLLSLPCCKAVCCECENCTRNYEGESDQKCSRPLLSKGLSPTCVHYNLTTINPKKSKQDEYLPYPAYKGDDDPLEEDDTEFVLQEMKRYRKE